MGTTADKLNRLIDTKSDIKSAINSKGVVVDDSDTFNDYADKIRQIKQRFTGHADREGLKEIGWTEDDIDLYQQYGVNWNEEDDKLHKVTEANINLYGVIDENNISNFVRDLIYMPKLRITKSDLTQLFYKLYYLVAIPSLDFDIEPSILTNMFTHCHSLVYIGGELDVSLATICSHVFEGCTNLKSVQSFYFKKELCELPYMFVENTSLKEAVLGTEDAQKAILNLEGTFANCYSLEKVRIFASECTNYLLTFKDCYNLRVCYIYGLKADLDISFSKISMNSLIYIINNSIENSNGVNITLRQDVWHEATNTDAVAESLGNHPYIHLIEKI